MSQSGFKEVYSLAGGINAWQGIAATGAPEWGMAFFKGSEDPAELTALSWAMEEGSRRFYEELAQSNFDSEVKETFISLATAEEKHKDMLTGLYYGTKAGGKVKEYPDYFSSPDEAGDIIEGGFKLSEAVKWAKGQKPAKIYEFSLMIEAQHFDLYTRMAGNARNEESKEIFSKIAAEEKGHLVLLTEKFEKEL